MSSPPTPWTFGSKTAIPKTHLTVITNVTKVYTGFTILLKTSTLLTRTISRTSNGSMSQMPSGQGKQGIIAWMVEFKGEPFPKKQEEEKKTKKRGGATGPLGRSLAGGQFVDPKEKRRPTGSWELGRLCGAALPAGGVASEPSGSRGFSGGGAGHKGWVVVGV